MKSFQQIVAWLYLLTAASVTWAAASQPAQTVNLPPSADLSYTVSAQYNGLSVNGNSSIQWKANKQSYTIRTETRLGLLGKMLEAESTGQIGATGLMPEKYVEKRLRKASMTTTFNRIEKTVVYPSGNIAKMKDMEQDRASIVWQLVSVARANPDKFVMNSDWTFNVAGSSKTEPWVFRVVKIGELSTPMGQIKTVQLTRTDSRDRQQNSVWLAPDYNWYPVQILLIEKNGTQIKQTIKKITPI